MELNYNSVETIPVLNASTAFKTDSGKVFKKRREAVVPWSGDKAMLYFAQHLADELCMFDNVPESITRFLTYGLLSSFATWQSSYKHELCRVATEEDIRQLIDEAGAFLV